MDATSDAKGRRRGNRGAALFLTVLLALGVGGSTLMPAGCKSPGGRHQDFFQQVRPVSDTQRLLTNASFLRQSGRLGLAVKELEEAHVHDPANLAVVDALSQCYEDLGRFERAQELYSAALQRLGSHPALENNRCYSLFLAGRLSQAEVCFREMLTRRPDDQTARNNLGLVLCRQGREADALALWREKGGEEAARRRLTLALAALGRELPPAQAASPAPTPAPAASPAKPAPTAGASPGSAPAAPQVVDRSAPEAAVRERQATALPATPKAIPRTTPQSQDRPAAPQPPAPPVMAAAPPPPPVPKPAPVAAASPSPTAKSSPVGRGASPEAKPPGMVKPAPTAKPAEPAQLDGKPAAVPPPTPPQPAVQAEPKPARPTPQLGMARIEIRNGSGVKNLARQTRSTLSEAGLTVVSIGNHVDFGLRETVIAYQPETAEVARVLADKFFTGARLEAGGQVAAGANIRVSLGGSAQTASPLASPPTAPPQATAPAEALRPSPATAMIPKANAAAPRPSGQQPAAPPPPPPLGALAQARLEVKNGSGIPQHAREWRYRLSLEGVTVVAIGNHHDFGLTESVIAYRPEMAHVARALAQKLLPGAKLVEGGKISRNANIRLSLGRDLIPPQEQLAQVKP